MFSPKILSLILGMISGLIFAPTFFVPGLLALAYLCYQVQTTTSWQQAAMLGFLFGFGHFLTGIYWISIGITVYIDEFWWAIPFALFGLPIILACFIAATCSLSFVTRNSNYYQFIFCLCWILFEWVRSWIFTGLPWNLLGYSLSFSDILIQPASIVGVYGLSFIVIYVSTSCYHIFTKKYDQLTILLFNSVLIISIIIFYGLLRLDNNPSSFSNIKVRLIQPSIPQVAKWDIKAFWHNLNLHILLSENSADPKLIPDLIIWSEAALIVPYHYEPVKNKLLKMLEATETILITGGVSNNGKQGDDFEIYTGLYALTQSGDNLFEYHKSHLVPFAEYMPLKSILPLKKLTHGFVDYTSGNSKLVRLDKFNLTIKPLICYESIFPSFVRTSNKIADVIINITNDAWYGKSSGPYQHLQMSCMRAVENGLPMLRIANNGISAIIDPVGRIIKKLDINEIAYIDGLLPDKLDSQTIYSQFGDICALIAVIIVLIIHYIFHKNLIDK